MSDFCKYVNVFHGSGKIDLPKPEGIAASWHFIKAICGNTHPGAMLPFGRMSVGCFTNGYPAGYGNHRGSSAPENFRTFGDEPECLGFSHIHQSGTGAMDIYYNYAVTTPCMGDISEALHGQKIVSEDARPGYYSVKLGNNISCELTATERIAIHRYVFPKSGGRIVIDLSNDGFTDDDPMHRGYSGKSYIRLLGKNAFEALVTMKGLPLYFYGECTDASHVSLWRDYLPLKNKLEFSSDLIRENFGVFFDLASAEAKEFRLSVSTVSTEKAREYVTSEKRSFEEIADDAYSTWNNTLSKIEIDAPTERDRDIFYSNLYHSLVKPSDWSGESCFGIDDFITDFATMWDIYKTQLPLIFTLYPEISKKIISTFISFCDTEGFFPHTFTLSTMHRQEHSAQARMLAEHSIADAYFRGVSGDYRSAVLDAQKDLLSEPYSDFRNGTDFRATHTVDIAEGCQCMAKLARELNLDSTVFDKYAAFPKKVFDEKTGLMISNSDYYEGSEWNYSFRPMHNMKERIDIACGSERFIGLLDKFFGYTDADDISARFEGYNNESDMETPVSYFFAGRHDRFCEIISAGLKYMFTDGRGGIPGNNDSGGLSSCYIWNAAGLFPISGQNLIIIGSPIMNKTVFHLANNKDFTVRRVGSGIYVKSASLCGTPLEGLSFKASQMMCGGELVLEMSELPVN